MIDDTTKIITAHEQVTSNHALIASDVLYSGPRCACDSCGSCGFISKLVRCVVGGIIYENTRIVMMRAIMLLDLENISPNVCASVFNIIQKHKLPYPFRTSGYVSSASLPDHHMELMTRHDMQIVPVYSFRKNSVDIRMVVDVMETLVHEPNIDTYYLVSSDTDFSHLVQKLNKFNKNVYGFGSHNKNKKFSMLFKDYFQIVNVEEKMSATDSTSSSDEIKLYPLRNLYGHISKRLDSDCLINIDNIGMPFQDRDRLEATLRAYPTYFAYDGEMISLFEQ